MKWVHKCDLNWLKMRQEFLTASDVKELLPVTKTGRPRKVGDEQYIKVLARKRSMIYRDDCISTGAAARGHILEPYAIMMFNSKDYEHKLFHWDDVIIPSDHNDKLWGLAFSPDACDIERLDGGVLSYQKPYTIGEVKSYGAERHMVCGITPPESLEERWQLATAMATCPSIERAYIIFYNPSTQYQMFTHCYERHDLADEIQVVLDVEKNFNDFFHDNEFALKLHFGSENDEKEIYDKESMAMNAQAAMNMIP